MFTSNALTPMTLRAAEKAVQQFPRIFAMHEWSGVEGLRLRIFSYKKPASILYYRPKLRNLRGIIYAVPASVRNPSGAGDERALVASLPLHKFFNVGEYGIELRSSVVHYAIEKLDGTMIQATAMKSSTSHLSGVNLLIASRSHVDPSISPSIAQAQEMMTAGRSRIADLLLAYPAWTFVFELVGIDEQTVHYDTPRLVLLAARHKLTGRYMGRRRLEREAAHYDVEIAPALFAETDFSAIERWLEKTEEKEGLVLYTDEDWYKAKTRWYLTYRTLLESFKKGMSLWNTLLWHYTADTLDDAEIYIRRYFPPSKRPLGLRVIEVIRALEDLIYIFLETLDERRGDEANGGEGVSVDEVLKRYKQMYGGYGGVVKLLSNGYWGEKLPAILRAAARYYQMQDGEDEGNARRLAKKARKTLRRYFGKRAAELGKPNDEAGLSTDTLLVTLPLLEALGYGNEVLRNV